MKKLLLLTDFTANAAHAAACAMQLCAQMNTDLLLYHSVQYVPIVPDFPNGGVITETNDILFKDSRVQLEQVTKVLKGLSLSRGKYHPEIFCENGEGSLAANVRELSSRQDIRLVVMGGRSGGALDHILAGSETSTVIGASRKPVMVIPASVEPSLLKKVVFATDFQPIDIIVLDFLIELTQIMGVHLEVVHVTIPASVVTNIEPELIFRKRINQLDPQAVSYQEIIGDDIRGMLVAQCQQNGPALLAMSHQRHGVFSQLFGHSESKKMLKQADLAVLVFPPDLEIV